MFAALLAEQGYTSAPAAIEGTLGWARAMGDVPTAAEMVDDLGRRWEFLANTYKPYPCGIVMHAVVDACLDLRIEHRLTAPEIAEIIVSGDQLLLDRGDRTVGNDRDARVSIHHCAAVSLLFGAAGLREFSDAVVHDPAVVALRELTQVRLDAASPRGAATVLVRTRDGRTLNSTVLHARGSVERPLSDDEIAAKVHDLAAFGGFQGAIDEVIAAVWQIDTMATIEPLVRLLGRS
jgi:2-methylcitrate dehydratase PrpD